MVIGWKQRIHVGDRENRSRKTGREETETRGEGEGGNREARGERKEAQKLMAGRHGIL